MGFLVTIKSIYKQIEVRKQNEKDNSIYGMKFLNINRKIYSKPVRKMF